ncbi:type I restriction endonuclease subunit R [Clostridium thermarum]|uniref:type I restriction endonuclease subunit R n=1 Tax=Clostridium thermarum TaxID=1716543 RepID=UPI0011224CD6|nr:type I restriction endonuclease subunit R [Clostridium thermarum]
MGFLIDFTEQQLENAAIEILKELDYEHLYGPDIAPDSESPERDDYREVILKNRVLDALRRLNPALPEDAIEEAYRKIITFNSPILEENNRYFHKIIVEGIDVTFKKQGIIKTEKAYIIDFKNVDNNEFLVVNQFRIEEIEKRRPDVIIFVNGIPLVVMELKSSTDENVGIEKAYNQIQTYKRDIPTLFYYNAFIVITDGINAKAGTITANFERFMNWRSIDGINVEPLSIPQYEILLKGMLRKDRLLDIVENFLTYQETSAVDYDSKGRKIGDKIKLNKILAAYHQYFAVKKAVENTEVAINSTDKKIGVVWHTQGSGKSFTMVFYAAQLVKKFNNPTIVVITDRNDLDDQLYNTFSQAKDILRQDPIQADVRKLSDEQKESNKKEKTKIIRGLFDLLNEREAGGIIFTTIQKFKPENGEMPVLTDRHNVIVIADEAHRSHYGLDAKADIETGDIKYGYAKYVRDALPNASFIGFTGTPIGIEGEIGAKSTVEVFGDYIDIYDMTRAVEDGATVKIYYENRIIKLEADEEELKKIDEEFEELMDGQEEEIKNKYKGQWSRLEAVVGSANRLKLLAQDIVNHFEERIKTIDGKAMIVCMSRKICADIYDEIINLRPDWHSDDLTKGKIKVVITGDASDDEKLQKHLTGGSQRKEILAKRMKDVNDELKIAIVRDMWLTGFDVPSMHTMYIDKPMKGHNLMQAIARVNRVFKDKPGGVIVDYIGIFESLKKALKVYTESDKKTTGIDTSVAVSIMLEKLEILKDMFHKLDYSGYMNGTEMQRIRAITEGMDFVLSMEEKEQKEFKNTVVELAKAHSLCASTKEGRAAALEVSYFKAVKASLVKLENKSTNRLSKREIEHRINQLLQKTIISEEVIDVFDSLGLERPNISILSDEFLEEVRSIKYKNLAVEMLKKLLEGKIKAIEKRNLVKSERFSEKLEKALKKYKNQAITNLEVIEELINLAKEIQKAREEDMNLGLSEDEIAFYDALTADDAVKLFMSDDVLKQIAHELTEAIRSNITVDWSKRTMARAKMRTIIKRLLKKYNYPPKQAEKAMDIVMRQVEKMCENEVEEIDDIEEYCAETYEIVADSRKEYRV